MNINFITVAVHKLYIQLLYTVYIAVIYTSIYYIKYYTVIFHVFLSKTHSILMVFSLFHTEIWVFILTFSEI